MTIQTRDSSIFIRDIREAHKKDSESAPQTTVADELKENLEAVENFKGSRDEKLEELSKLTGISKSACFEVPSSLKTNG